MAGPHEPSDDDPERHADGDAGDDHRGRRPPRCRPRSAERQPERPPDRDVAAAGAQHGHDGVEQPGDAERAEECGEHHGNAPASSRLSISDGNSIEKKPSSANASCASLATGDEHVLQVRFAAVDPVARDGW